VAEEYKKPALPDAVMGDEPLSIIIRDETPADAEAVGWVYIHVWQQAYRGLVPDEFLDNLRPRPRINTAPASGRRAVAMEEDGRIIAVSTFSACRDEDAGEDTGEIISIYLLADCWGRGLGRRLLTYDLDGLRAMGFRSCTLWTLEGNRRARRAYERAGFALDGAEKTEMIGGRPLDQVRYRIRLWD
jgi:RimJ/RimL family protein N-acetyltransferase